jgi:excinuclease ABC subunit C
MISQDLKKYKLSDTPGVYLFINRKLKTKNSKLKTKDSERILYIGKATSLKDRVKSYFSKDIAFARSLLIEQMVEEADSIKTLKTDSVLEALILESNLIKKHKPKYNTKEKDDKSFNFAVITDEEYPRVFTMRAHELQTNLKSEILNLKSVFGPYPQGGSLKEALKIIRKIFPFRGQKDPTRTRFDLVKKGRKSYLNEEIGISPKFSVGVDKKEYAKTIKNIKLFFQGKSSQVLKNLRTEMKSLAKKQEFERADEKKRQIFALGHINDLALIKEQKTSVGSGFRVEAYDVAHISGSNMVGVMVALVDGEPRKSFYRKFKIHQSDKLRCPTPQFGDTTALAQILERRLDHPEWQLPKLIVVDGGKAQKNTAERILAKFGYQIPVVAVVKGVGHKPRGILGQRSIISKREADILLANHESHRFALAYHREKRRKNLN